VCRPPVTQGRLPQETHRQQWDVLRPLAQWDDFDREHVEVEVRGPPEAARLGLAAAG